MILLPQMFRPSQNLGYILLFLFTLLEVRKADPESCERLASCTPSFKKYLNGPLVCILQSII